jgi:hypothetical protein
MDPKRASGIPRVDSGVPAGTLTVRCLLGGFDQPAVGVKVELELRSADGSTEEHREAEAVGAGRATFEGLDAFIGGTAVASVDFGGDVVRSQAIPLDARAGSRVMLVKGAGSPAGSAPAGPNAGGHGAPGAHGGAEIPIPGQPFPLDDRPVGMIVAGALDLEKGGAIEGIEVRLEARLPDAAEDADPIVRTAQTNADGRALFEGLLPPEFPEGTKFTVEAVLAPGDEPQRSAEFQFEDRAVAIVLTRGHMASAPPPGQAKQRRETLPARVDASVAAGSVKVAIIDGNDQPVPNLEVQVVKKDVTGSDVSYTATTGSDGVALVEGVKVQSDAFYFAGVVYDGGPYQSSFFQLPETTGASVELRVFPTTADVSRIRSGVHYEVRPLENDSAQVIRVFEVFVDGEEAYWRPGGFRVYGAPGSRFVKPLPRATRWLEEREGAPFASLTGPIPPGEVIELSIAYVVDHDGSVAADWNAPFPVIQAGVALEVGLDLVRGAQGPPETPPHQTGVPTRIWKFTPPEYRKGPCDIALAKNPDFVCPDLLASMGGSKVEIEVEGLPTRPRIYRSLAIGFGAVVLLFIGMAMVLQPRIGRREALLARREALLTALRDLPEDAEGGPRRGRILGALDRVYRQLDALGEVAPAKAKK